MQVIISVIISIYNIENYLPRCIESVLEQSYMPKEIILVNDGSTDSSLDICKNYSEKFPSLIKVIDKANGGLSSARNAGLLQSVGGYVYFIDGDDYILPHTLESFVELLELYGRLDFIHGRMSFFSDENEKLVEHPYYIDNKWENGPSTGQRLFADAYKYQGGLAMGVRGIYSRDFLIDNKLLFVEKDFSWGEDEEWTPRVFMHANRVAGNDKPFYCYRENRAGSESTKLANLKAALLMLEVYANWLNYKTECSDESFRKVIKQEAGKRYVWCVISNSRKLNDKDVNVFLTEANNYKMLSKNANGLNKLQEIFKWLILMFGASIAGHFYRRVVKVKNRLFH